MPPTELLCGDAYHDSLRGGRRALERFCRYNGIQRGGDEPLALWTCRTCGTTLAVEEPTAELRMFLWLPGGDEERARLWSSLSEVAFAIAEEGLSVSVDDLHRYYVDLAGNTWKLPLYDEQTAKLLRLVQRQEEGVAA